MEERTLCLDLTRFIYSFSTQRWVSSSSHKQASDESEDKLCGTGLGEEFKARHGASVVNLHFRHGALREQQNGARRSCLHMEASTHLIVLVTSRTWYHTLNRNSELKKSILDDR
eukprot:scaffold21267_cov32-Tisochrysis_lutea.AAC.5